MVHRRLRQEWLERLRPAVPRSANAVVVRGLASLALAWQGLWVIADPALWPTRQGLLLPALAIAASIVTWLAMLIVHPRGSSRARRLTRAADVSALTVATAVVLVTQASAASPDWGPASSLASLTAGLAGILLPLRVAGIWIPAIVLLEAFVILDATALAATPDARAPYVLYPGYALAIGVSAAAARLVLIKDAHRADAAAAELTRAERGRRTAQGVSRALHAGERLLHETVLNTLTAIDRGGLTSSSDMRARLAVRCRQASQVLRELREQSTVGLSEPSEQQDLVWDVDGLLIDLNAAGVSVSVDCDPLDACPAPVYAALRSAAREALSNVLRHAAADSVWISAHVVRVDGGQRIHVEIRDDGGGFTADDVPARFGLRGAIETPMAEVGGTARIQAAPGRGTVVALSWASQDADDVPRFQPSAPGLAVPTLGSFGLYTAATVALLWPTFVFPWLNAAAFALFAALAVLVAVRSFDAPLPWWLVLVVCGVSPLVYTIQQQGIDPTSDVPWAVWSSVAIAALFLVVVGTGPRWTWLALVFTWLMIQGDVVGELLQPGTAIIVAGALFGRSTRRNTASYERSRAEALHEETALAVARESVRRLHRHYGALTESRAIDLLDGIADGTVDPDTPEVRAAAALEERFVRTIIRVDPAVDPVHALAASLAVRAHRCGVYLDVDLADSDAGRRAEVNAGKRAMIRAIDTSTPGQVGRLTARREGAAFVIRLVVPIDPARLDEVLVLASDDVEVLTLGPDEPAVLLEVRHAT